MNSPFKFLESYTKDDKDLFFGRDRETEELYQRVFNNRILLVYGISGTGKSSLINCGLANKFQETDWLPMVIRRGNNINESLAVAIKNASVTPQRSKFIGPAGFSKGVRSLYLDYYKPVCFIFDQFEELFIFGDKEERKSFISIVKSLVESDLQCRLIFLLREEYMACITEFEKYIPTIFTNRVRIEKISHSKALETIKGPCRVAGITLSEGFAEKLLEKLSPEGVDVELTYLQVFLDRIFRLATENSQYKDSLTFSPDLLEKAGNVSDLLGSFLDEQLALLDNPDEALTVLKSFVSVKGTRRQMSPDEVNTYAKSMGHSPAEASMQDLIRKFISLRILNEKDQNGKYELRHDALARKIFEKFTLVEKEILEIRQFLENALGNYSKRGVLLSSDDLDYIAPYERRLFLTDEFNSFIEESRRALSKAKQRRRNFAMAAVIALLLIFAIFTAWALKERSTAIAQSKHSRALSLASEARETFSINPTRAVRYAQLAYNLDSLNYIVNQTLSDAFHNTSSNPVFTASLNHHDQVFKAVFSPDGKKILTASKDGTARLWDLSGNCLVTFADHRAGVNCAVFSPDGEKILTSSPDFSAKLWDISGKCLVTLCGHNGEVFGVRFSPDGKMVLTFSSDRTARLWSLSGKCLATLSGHETIIESASFSSDGKYIVTASDDMTARLWNLSGRCLAVMRGHTALTTTSVFSALFSPDSKLIVTASADKTARIWDINGKCIRVLQGHTGSVYSACFSPDGKTILTSSFDNSAKLWDLNGRCLTTYTGHSDAVYEANYSPDGQFVVTAASDKTAKIWSLDGQCLATLSGHTEDLYSAVFSPDGHNVLTASEDNSAKLWAFSGRHYDIFQGHTKSVWSATYSNNGKYILTASDDMTARLWNTNGNCVAILSGHSGIVYNTCFSPDDNYILTASGDKTAKMWDLSGRCLVTFSGHNDNVAWARFSPDGKKIITASRDMTARIWDLSGQCLAVLMGHIDGLFVCEFSPDGSLALTTSADHSAKIWDLSGRCLATMFHNGPIGSAAFSPDGKKVVTTSFDRTAQLWDLNGNHLVSFIGHSLPVYTAAFSPDGKTLLTSSMDRTAKLWDMTGHCLATFTGHTHDVIFASFSPEGKTVATASADKTARLWDLDGTCLVTFTGHSGTVYSAKFSPEGTNVVTASADNSARLWYTKNAVLDWLRSAKFGELTPAEKTVIEEPWDYRTVASSDNATLLTDYANWYLNHTDTAKAVELYQKALKINQLSYYREILGSIYQSQGKHDSYLNLFKDQPGQIIKDELFNLADTTSDENLNGKFQYFNVRAGLFERLVNTDDDPGNKIDAARNYANLTWYALLSGKYPPALDASRRGLALDPSNNYLLSYVPLCLLFSGNTEEAFKNYTDLKNKPWTADDSYSTFSEAFIADINYFLNMGVNNPGLLQAREILTINNQVDDRRKKIY